MDDWSSYCKRTTSLSNGPCVKQNWSLIILAVLGLIGLGFLLLDPKPVVKNLIWLSRKKDELFPPKDRSYQDTKGNWHRPGGAIVDSPDSFNPNKPEPIPPRKDQAKNKIHTIVGCAQKDGMMKC